MAINFVDRKSAKPNRYKVTTESGETFFAVLERADEPIIDGTPLNAETLNAIQGKARVLYTGTIIAPYGGVSVPDISKYICLIVRTLKSEAYSSIIVFRDTTTDSAFTGWGYVVPYGTGTIEPYWAKCTISISGDTVTTVMLVDENDSIPNGAGISQIIGIC